MMALCCSWHSQDFNTNVTVALCLLAAGWLLLSLVKCITLAQRAQKESTDVWYFGGNKHWSHALYKMSLGSVHLCLVS